MDSWQSWCVHYERLFKTLGDNGYPAYTFIRINSGLFHHILETIRASRKKKMGRSCPDLQSMDMAENIWKTLVVDPTILGAWSEFAHAHYHEREYEHHIR